MAVALAVALLPAGGPASALAPDTGSTPASGAAKSRTVTLITGDQVVIAGQSVTVTPALDRPKARFLIRQTDGDQQVIPMDALPMLRSGQLDSRLFNITLLLRFGYDNQPDGLPLLVARSGLSVASVAGARVTRDLPTAKLAAVTPGRGTAFWKSLTAQTAARRGSRTPVTKVWLNGKRELTLDTSVPLVGAPAAWQAGFDGTGVTVAVLDTGIDATHPDLAGKVIAARDFTGTGQADRRGHGTHIASTIAGSGAASGGRYRGVAPGVRLIDAKVCAPQCYDSEILDGLAWAVEQGARMVNMSFGSFDFPEVDPVEQAVTDYSAQYGTLFVISAGNDPVRRVGSPASTEASLAVGATTKTDQLADFSSRGPRAWDGGLKPDIAAPGVGIVAARGKDMTPVQPDQRYVSFTGTSMSAPHVIGAAAILSQRHPDWRGETLKSVLMGSAKPLPGVTAWGVGSGRLDVARAYQQSVVSEPRTINFGEHLWPHTGPAVGRPVTYLNHGTEPVTLTLTTTNVAGPAGQPVPTAGFYADPSTVTVPAGGQAEVQLFADSKAIGAIYGSINGNLLATSTSGSTVVNTRFALENEEESYDLHILHIGRDGAPAGGFETTIKRLDKPGSSNTLPGSPNKIRVPKGRYTVYSAIGSSPETLDTMMIQPEYALTRNDTLVVDARKAKPVVVTPPRDDLRWHAATVGGHYEVPGNASSFQIFAPNANELFVGRAGPEKLLSGFRSFVRATLYEPGPSGSFFDSPGIYHLAWFTERRVMDGFTRHVKPRDLAAVNVKRTANGPGGLSLSSSHPVPAGTGGQTLVDPGLFAFPPYQRTEYFSTEDGLRWSSFFQDNSPTFNYTVIYVSEPTRYLPNRTYAEKWGYGVLGPTFPKKPLERMLARDGNSLHVRGAYSGDSEGRYGRIPDAPGKLRVYRDGVEIYNTPLVHSNAVTLPAGPATYRVESDALRVHGDLSKEVNMRWTFQSAHTEPGTETPLPAWAVRYTPDVDEFGTAAYGGKAVRIPVIAESQSGSEVGTVRRIIVQASVDGGQTWTDAPLTRTRTNNWTALVTHPTGDGFITLRATVEDSKGNLLEQRIVNAYRYSTPS